MTASRPSRFSTPSSRRAIGCRALRNRPDGQQRHPAEPVVHEIGRYSSPSCSRWFVFPPPGGTPRAASARGATRLESASRVRHVGAVRRQDQKGEPVLIQSSRAARSLLCWSRVPRRHFRWLSSPCSSAWCSWPCSAITTIDRAARFRQPTGCESVRTLPRSRRPQRQERESPGDRPPPLGPF